jgi:hypothetical protein
VPTIWKRVHVARAKKSIREEGELGDTNSSYAWRFRWARSEWMLSSRNVRVSKMKFQ